jgi:hypothetical protein
VSGRVGLYEAVPTGRSCRANKQGTTHTHTHTSWWLVNGGKDGSGCLLLGYCRRDSGQRSLVTSVVIGQLDEWTLQGPFAQIIDVARAGRWKTEED